ncbi:MAG: hypothetical protein MUF72_13190 [Elainella sp. Prado103]|nr:hypothetical protein [Elainella sp. Prado103]
MARLLRSSQPRLVKGGSTRCSVIAPLAWIEVWTEAWIEAWTEVWTEAWTENWMQIQKNRGEIAAIDTLVFGEAGFNGKNFSPPEPTA